MVCDFTGLGSVVRRLFAWSAIFCAVSAPLQAASTLDRGYVSKNAARSGIVLHLHGCDGLSSKGWIKEWFDQFERSGYKVFAPDSFADDRPAKSCSAPWANKSKIIQLRMRQTEEALLTLRERYKGKKIYVWGHSEGAQLLNRMAIDVSGAVTTGYGCGYGRKPRIWLPVTVPLLALSGNSEHDHFLREEAEFKGEISVDGLCGSLMSNRIWRWKSFDVYGHIIPIWDRDVRVAVNSVIPIKLSSISATSLPREIDPSRYKLTKKIKRVLSDQYFGKADETAFAIGPDGSYGYSDSSANMADAITIALFWCNKFTRKVKTSNNCAVYAANDIVLGSQPPTQTARLIQEKLFDLKFLEGPIDGKWGRHSAKAYADFRSSAGLLKNAAIDVSALRALGLVK